MQGPSADQFQETSIGLTVRELTYEVRKVLRLPADAPGVVVSKVESGSKAAVAQIGPYEIISAVNGQPATSLKEFERLVRQHGKLRVLFDMTGFNGWEAGALWEDTKFAANHFADIERIAMVGETTWQHGMAMFCKPFTRATVRYFDHARAAEARTWLDEA